MRKAEIRGKILEMRIRLEKNLIFIMEQQGLAEQNGTVKENLNLLKELKVIDRALYDTAFNIMQLGNKAAHDEVTEHDELVAERYEKKLEDLFQEQELITMKKSEKQKSFEELFLGSQFYETKKLEKNKKSFEDILEEYEKDAFPKVNKTPEERVKEKNTNISGEPKSEKKPVDFGKLLDEFDDFEE